MKKSKYIFAKYIVTLLFIGVFILGLVQGVQEAAQGQTVVGAILVGDQHKGGITISGPADVSDWMLVPGIVNEMTGTMHVHARGSWQIKVSSDKVTNGYMTEYNLASANFKSKKLKNSMKLKAEDNEVDLKDGGVLLTHIDKNNDYKDQSIDIPITFKQLFTWYDDALPEGHVYRLAITFTASSTV